MKFLIVWPDIDVITRKFITKYLILVITCMPCTLTILHGLLRYLQTLDDIYGILEPIIALVAIGAMFYMSHCFMRNLNKIRALVIEVESFVRFGAKNVLRRTEIRIKKYTKGALTYLYVTLKCSMQLFHTITAFFS